MIEQQINLYRDRFRERRLWISASQVSTLLLVVIVGIAAWRYYLHGELAEDQRRNLEIKADKERMSAELAAAHSDLIRLPQENRVDRDIADTAGKISLRENFVQIMGSSLSADRVPDYLARFWLRCYAEPKMIQIETKQKEYRVIGNEWVGI